MAEESEKAVEAVEQNTETIDLDSKPDFNGKWSCYKVENFEEVLLQSGK